MVADLVALLAILARSCPAQLRKDLEQQEEYKRRIKVMTEEKKARRS